MASVFLSYDREDAGKARSIATALEKVGHSVWWDRHIAGGAQYGTEIEEALERSDAVVVLWSASAVRSAWVRDEAAAGRDAGKLVPARLDSTDPPMGFRQYQTVDLSRWKGTRSAGAFDELNRAVDGLGAQSDTPTPVVQRSVPARARNWRRRGLLTGAILAILIVGAWLVSRMARSTAAPIVAVATADESASSRQLARDLLVKLGTLQGTDTNPIELVDQGSGRTPNFTFRIAGSQVGTQTHASVTLTDQKQTLLWSKDFNVPASQIGDLKQQIALSAGRVLECATQAISSGELDQPTLKLYLNGCATLSGLAGNEFRALVPVFRRVTKNAPRFEGGWGQLLLTETFMVGWESLPADSSEAATLRRDIAEARQRYPRIPEAYWAEYLLNIRNLERKAEIIHRAIEAHPNHPLLVAVHANFLFGVGRLAEAVQAAKRAAELSPLSPDETSAYINLLGWSGKADLAQAELDKAERMWPGASNLVDSRWRHHLRYGDPKEALRISRSGANAGYADQEAYLRARIDPTQANVERAISYAKSRIPRDPRAMGMLAATLAEFGREEEVFAILEGPRKAEIVEAGFDAFFRPAYHRLRHDPRFMKAAHTYGLVDYWRKSGKWPDFCFEPDLPYDCKAEAAKLN